MIRTGFSEVLLLIIGTISGFIESWIVELLKVEERIPVYRYAYGQPYTLGFN